jgi:hypothetical protein
MAFERQADGFYHVPIVDLGTRLRDNFGLTIKEHSHFDDVDKVHAPNSYHYYDEALDIQDWRGGSGEGAEGFDGVGFKQRTKNLRDLMRGSGAEVIGPGDMAGHETHLHLAAKDGIFKLNDQQYQHLFGGNAGGKGATFASFSPPEATQQPDGTPKPAQVEAATRAKEYSKMNKAEMNSAYDSLRASDPAKAGIEGKKMHRAFFNK